MDRRNFLKLFGGGLVATATIQEAGMLAEFMDWMKRKPVWSFPSKSRTYDDINAITLKYVTPCLIDDFFKPTQIFWDGQKFMPLIYETR